MATGIVERTFPVGQGSSVVAREYHNGVVGKATFIQDIQHFPHGHIHSIHFAAVVCQLLAHSWQIRPLFRQSQ